MKSISYTVVTASGKAFDYQFPLHPQTQSEAGVTQIVTDSLDLLSKILHDNQQLCNGDVLQALAMVFAVRAQMLADESDAVDKLSLDLLQTALQATRDIRPYAASRA